MASIGTLLRSLGAVTGWGQFRRGPNRGTSEPRTRTQIGAAKRAASDVATTFQMLNVSDFAAYVRALMANSPEIVRSGSLKRAHGDMAGRRYRFHVLGEDIWVDGAQFGLAQEIYGRRVYFPFPGFLPGPDDTVIDLGANAGVFSTLAGKLAHRVLAVEAQREFLPEIRRNAEINGCADRVEVLWALVGADSGLFSREENLRMASHYGGTPPAVSMSQILREHGLERVDFLKVDIEGSEFGIFSTPDDWLTRVSCIAMEVHPAFGDSSGLVATLRGAGFDVILMDNDHNELRTAPEVPFFAFARRAGC